MLPVATPAVATFVSQFTSLACWQTHAQAMAKASIEVILSNANRMRRTNCDERHANLASLLRAVRRGGPDVEQLCRLINLRGADAYGGRGRRDEEHDR